MTKPITSSPPPPEVRCPTADDILEQLCDDKCLTPNRRAELKTTVRRIVRFAGHQHGRKREPREIPFAPFFVRPILNRLTPENTGLAAKSLSNDRTNANFLFDRYTLGGWRQHQAPLTAEMEDFLGRLPADLGNPRRAWELLRFFRFLAAAELSLKDVGDDISARFLEALERDTILKTPPRTIHQTLCRNWNRAIALAPELDLTPLSVPRYRDTYGRPWSAFPPSLKAAVDDFLATSAEADLLDLDKPYVQLRPRTIITQKDWIRTLASCAVQAGISVNRLRGLQDLVDVETFQRALRWRIHQEPNRKPTLFIGQLAYMGLKIVRFGAALPEAQRERIEIIVRNVRTMAARQGASEKRLMRLEQFDSQRNQDRLIVLADYVFARLLPKKNSHIDRRSAADLGLAVFHDLLLYTSLRRGNLADLDIVNHLVRLDTAVAPRYQIRRQPADVKNDQLLVKELPAHLIERVDLYLEHVRPIMTNDLGNPYFFPGRTDGHVNPQALGLAYRRFVQKWTGLDVNPHLMRSFADLIYTDVHPEGGEVMMRHLGHKSPRTRSRHYADPRSLAASRDYVGLVLDRRSGALGRIEDIF